MAFSVLPRPIPVVIDRLLDLLHVGFEPDPGSRVWLDHRLSGEDPAVQTGEAAHNALHTGAPGLPLPVHIMAGRVLVHRPAAQDEGTDAHGLWRRMERHDPWWSRGSKAPLAGRVGGQRQACRKRIWRLRWQKITRYSKLTTRGWLQVQGYWTEGNIR